MPDAIRKITNESLLPDLEIDLHDNYGIDLFPYVDLKGRTPEGGIVSFNDLPRYSMWLHCSFSVLKLYSRNVHAQAFP